MTGKIKSGLTGTLFFILGMTVMLSRQGEIVRLNDEAAEIRRSDAAFEARIVAGHNQSGAPVRSPADLLKGSGRNHEDIARDALRYVSGLKPEELAGALDGLKKMPFTYATDLVRNLILSRWGNENPAGALA